MQLLKVLAGPLIGALIGYGTNYIAVKMLFRPLYPVKVGRVTLPFTPGIIPRRKQALAHAIGMAVGNTLLTGEDLRAALSGGEAREKAIEEITNAICSDAKICDLLNDVIPSDQGKMLLENTENILCGKIADALADIDIGGILAMEGGDAIREAVEGTMLAMFLTDELIQSFAGPIGERFRNAVLENQDKILRPAIHKELMKAGESSTVALIQKIGLERAAIGEFVAQLYDRLIAEQLDSILKSFDIVSIVEQKMTEMRVEELEELVLSVMKNELDAIVRLGALIGFVIGLLNLLLL
ncbi:MAG: DUF445 domain-containing protein [Oscillospiraceae bacterium]|jgi:uncharacterized membrane protein YheB (UPF0754 family)